MPSSRATLKTFFETGDIPTQAQFASLIDSLASLADTNLFEAENTHAADIKLNNNKVIKAASGGGTLDLRNGADGAVALSPDTVNFLVGWLFADTNFGQIGWGDSSSLANDASTMIFGPNQAKVSTETPAGVFGDRLEFLEDKIGWNGKTPIPRPNVTGSRAGNAALASLLTALDSLGIITDSTTA